MKKTLARAAVVAAAAAGLAVMPAGIAHADPGQTYTAMLNPVNGSGGSGMVKIWLNGDQAKVTENWSGLASTFSGAPYPHVQHIHIGGQGQCPTMSADTNGDGVISTTEGVPAYGGVSTTLSVTGDTSAAAATNLKIAPSGSSTNYSRTITLDGKTVAALHKGNAVVVVHGLDPATLSKKAQQEKSDLVPSLPLAATSPALCGVLTMAPTGGPQTGSGSTAGIEHGGLFGLGGGLLTAAGALVWMRRRTLANAKAAR
ncbi:MAG TPA: hypothetical protein VHO26_03830 [Propionibacteriaceae bacterium]|nr:hypothetical protein [Propionibacteriaceae bacterium]